MAQTNPNESKVPRFGANIKVVGVGGAGGNAINRMIEMGLKGVDFIALNTDAQALSHNLAPTKLQIGSKCTGGLGAGGNPEIGQRAAMESKAEISEVLDGADMIFVTAGMGGGTGTGACPIVAELSKEKGALTIGVVTKPFIFEGYKRNQEAQEGVDRLRESLDTLIIIPNDKLEQVIEETTTMLEAFTMADDVLRQGVQGISDLIVKPGLINLDFADVKQIMRDAGTALIGIGGAEGAERAITAANLAITSPLSESTIQGASGILVNITAGPSLRMNEVRDAMDLIEKASDRNSNIIFGVVIDPAMGEEVRVTVVATGFRTAGDETPVIPIQHELRSDRGTGFGPALTPLQIETSSRPASNGGAPPQDELDIPSFLRKGGYKV
ncbi:MAG TPA: cell division protein FtsZ [bacterium]|nr:cell division protein FtsZ [bacterium]